MLTAGQLPGCCLFNSSYLCSLQLHHSSGAHVERKLDPHEVDVQAAQILNGLRELEQLLEEPETEEALDLAKNARTTEQYNILRRLRKSLTQYLEREGDLFYVGLVGHFSSGKSSTINSILQIWGTDHERETDLNPTDTSITLITSDANAKSLLGVIREGHVTIRHESVDNDLLRLVVLADTPGSGDTQFVEEVARDFLPICDVVLFFFSATSPLDKTDLPLLTEIHKRLQFIPIRFIITRADEFRIDASKPVSDSNIDNVRRDRFLGEVLTRLNKLLSPMVYTEEQFILIDNKTPRYNIDKIVDLIRSKCDPLAALQDQARPLIGELGELKIPSPVSGSREIAPIIEAEKAELISLISARLKDDTQNLMGRLSIRLSGAVAEGRRQYELDIATARRKRGWLYATMIVGSSLLAFAGYIFYAYINRDVSQDIANAVIWNLVATVMSGTIGAFIAKWRDDFPRATKRILEDSQAILRERILGVVEEEFKVHEFSALNEAFLSEKLLGVYNRIIEFDPDGWNQVASERLEILRRYDTELRRLRGEFERSAEAIFAQTSSYFSDASKNLERLNEVAARVKARAIEPSFQLLAKTRDSLNEVKKQFHAVEFSH